MIHLEGGLYPEGSYSDVLFLFLFYSWMRACKWGTYKGQYIRHYPLSVPYSAFFEAVQNVKFDKDKWLTPAGHA